jgi:HK97 family phage prohead protease
MSKDRPPLEIRSAVEISGVNHPERLITVIAVPYEETALVKYRGEVWAETFLRNAFDGIEQRAGNVRVNREHRKGDTVGKIVRFEPAHSLGLLTDIQVAKTVRGEETLALAEDGMISASVGYGVRPSDQLLNRDTTPPRRVIRKAFLDHLSLVEDPAYDGAKVLEVRETERDEAADMLLPETPALDEWMSYLARRQGAGSR